MTEISDLGSIWQQKLFPNYKKMKFLNLTPNFEFLKFFKVNFSKFRFFEVEFQNFIIITLRIFLGTFEKNHPKLKFQHSSSDLPRTSFRCQCQ
jgi:hypothetical protein